MEKTTTMVEEFVGATGAPHAVRQSLPASYKDYLRIARLDHSTKHIFILPGIILALVLRGSTNSNLILSVVAGFASAVLIASSNYVINEWLDRHYDAFHPEKSKRTAVSRELSPAIVYFEYSLLALGGLLLAYMLGKLFFITAAFFVVCGLAYNVPPIRTKDRVYLDVLSESVNNPIRLVLGWAMIDPTSLPPASLIIAYWMGGAFLMTAKRFSEYRDIVAEQGVEVLHLYRRSFKFYSSETLAVCCLLYAILSAFFIAVFLIKYRVEYVLAMPFIAALFSLYFWLALRPHSIAQKPERLMKSRRLVAVVALTVFALIFLSFVDIPLLDTLSDPQFIPI